MKIIPAINEIEISEAVKKLAALENVCDWAQVDIADGIFLERKTNFGPADLAGLKTNLNLEIHLMVDNPEEDLAAWLALPAVKRAVVHIEAVENWKKILEIGAAAGKEIGAVVDLETEKEMIVPLLEKICCFVFMGVTPGSSGRQFHSEILEKMKWLKEARPSIMAGLDGGVNLETIGMIKVAGADAAYSGSFVFSGDPKEKIDLLLQA